MYFDMISLLYCGTHGFTNVSLYVYEHLFKVVHTSVYIVRIPDIVHATTHHIQTYLKVKAQNKFELNWIE